MPFCPNCGKEVSQNDRFCPQCGNKVNVENVINGGIEERPARKIEYHGELRKCPSCGEPISGLDAICPSCGYEFTVTSINAVIQEFSEKLTEYDQKIALEPTPQLPGGYKTWSKSGRTWWIIANVFLACYPLIIYFIVQSTRRKKLLVTPCQKEKAAFVKNYTFPNNREALIEALLFIKQQMSVLIGDSINELSQYWERIWFSKASQIYSKTEMSMKDDKTAQGAFLEIQSIDKEYQKRRIIKIAIIILAILILFLFASLGRNTGSNGTTIPTLQTIPTNTGSLGGWYGFI